MSKICIVGLGNPGEKYNKNRHNVGFMAVDYLQSLSSSESWRMWKNIAYISKYILNNITLYYVKPATFMNLSGMAVGQVLKYWQINTDNLIVIHDDLDIAVGKIKFKKNGGSAGHNGIKNCSEILGTKNYYRVRIGIDRELNSITSNYVLKDFSKKDKISIENVLYFLGKEIPKLCSSKKGISDKEIQIFNENIKKMDKIE